MGSMRKPSVPNSNGKPDFSRTVGTIGRSSNGSASPSCATNNRGEVASLESRVGNVGVPSIKDRRLDKAS